MECLQSFNIRINQASLATNSNGIVTSWGTANQYFWSLLHYPNNQNSVYNLQGFKRTDIYGIKVTGYVQGNFASSTKCAIVNDWSFVLVLNGTSPLISGNIGATDGFQINTTSPGTNIIAVNKYTDQVFFENPFFNVRSIQFQALQASGIGGQFLNEVDLLYDLSFTFYYKYEGE